MLECVCLVSKTKMCCFVKFLLFQNKDKVCKHLNELNGWSVWWTLAHSLFPLWLQSSDILVYTTTLNILKQDDHWEIYLRSLNIHVWGVVISLFGLLCFLPPPLLFLKNSWFQVYSVDVFPIVMTRPRRETPFVTLFCFCFLYVCFWHVLFYFILSIKTSMQFFQRKFSVTSVIKFYPKIWELWVHNYFCAELWMLQSFLYSMNFQIRQIQTKKQHLFSGNNNPFSIKPTVVWIKISEYINFSGFKSLYLFQKGQNNGAKISAFDPIRGISRKIYPWHWFYR